MSSWMHENLHYGGVKHQQSGVQGCSPSKLKTCHAEPGEWSEPQHVATGCKLVNVGCTTVGLCNLTHWIGTYQGALYLSIQACVWSCLWECQSCKECTQMWYSGVTLRVRALSVSYSGSQNHPNVLLFWIDWLGVKRWHNPGFWYSCTSNYTFLAL